LQQFVFFRSAIPRDCKKMFGIGGVTTIVRGVIAIARGVIGRFGAVPGAISTTNFFFASSQPAFGPGFTGS
jgi:hypothetical protein